MIWLLLGSVAAASECSFTVDGQPTARLDCSAGGAWRVTCPLPSGRSGKVRVRLLVPDRGLEAEARVPMSAGDSIDLALMGPGGRAGAFLVERASGGLLPGQAVGPIQLCPVVQPGVKPGSPPVALPIEVLVSEHQQTGFAEQPMDGGVTNRVPVYDAGVTIAKADATVVQLPVRDIPILAGALPLLRDEAIDGTLSVRGQGEQWHTIAWTGSLRDVPVETGDLVLATFDFSAAEIEAAMGPGDAVALVEADLAAWSRGDLSAQLGLVAWARSELKKPREAVFEGVEEKGRRWRRADLGRAEIHLARVGERVRVVIAHRSTPLDDAARAAIRGAAAAL